MRGSASSDNSSPVSRMLRFAYVRGRAHAYQQGRGVRVVDTTNTLDWDV